jgi:hypothetical protein
MIGFIGTSLQLKSIMTVHNQWLSTTRSIPYWTTGVFSSAVTNDERRIIAHTLNSLNSYWTPNKEFLTNESLEFTNELPFITARESNRDHRLQGFHYCSSWMRRLGNVHEPLPSKMGNSVSGSTIPAFRRLLPNRCLANGHIPSQYIIL